MTHNIILFELDFNVTFPLLHHLQYLSDLRRTNLFMNSKIQLMFINILYKTLIKPIKRTYNFTFSVLLSINGENNIVNYRQHFSAK